MRQITLGTLEYPTKAKAKIALQERVLDLNGGPAFKAKHNPTFGLVIDRFIKDEQLQEILQQPPGKVALDGLAYSTAAGYLSYLRKHIRPRWGKVPINAIKPLDVIDWLTALPLAGKTRGHLKGVMHMLFEKAMLWGLFEIQRNPMELVKVKGVTKRKKKVLVLTAEQCQGLIDLLPDPYKTMTIVAMCTGLRISEVLALRWESINFFNGTMLVQQGVVNGRVGRLKTDASEDEIPLDTAFVVALLKWRDKTSGEGLVFPSPSTGGCYYAGMIESSG